MVCRGFSQQVLAPDHDRGRGPARDGDAGGAAVVTRRFGFPATGTIAWSSRSSTPGSSQVFKPIVVGRDAQRGGALGDPAGRCLGGPPPLRSPSAACPPSAPGGA